jgi:predicted  nucleic acid-binding Zn-ribbon protein
VQPQTLARLLDLQEQDSAIRLLHHRRDTLAEAQRLKELNEQLAELDADIEIAEKQRLEIGRDQSRLEGEISMLEQKIQNEETRLFSGKVANPRELSSLQAEVNQNRTKRAVLEDDLLDVMVQREQAEETFTRLSDEREQVGGAAEELSQTVGALFLEIDGELQRHTEQRERLASDMPSDLLDRYERIRATRHGVGAAALVNGTCQGCHTKLPATEVERIKREGGLQRCENCGRILVVRS